MWAEEWVSTITQMDMHLIKTELIFIIVEIILNVYILPSSDLFLMVLLYLESMMKITMKWMVSLKSSMILGDTVMVITDIIIMRLAVQ